MSRVWGGLSWSTWIMLDADLDVFRENIPTLAGFYRVRGDDNPCLFYVGQTGRSLRERTRALASGVIRARNNPPWNDPHTAAPLLWAYRREDGIKFIYRKIKNSFLVPLGTGLTNVARQGGGQISET